MLRGNVCFARLWCARILESTICCIELPCCCMHVSSYCFVYVCMQFVCYMCFRTCVFYYFSCGFAFDYLFVHMRRYVYGIQCVTCCHYISLYVQFVSA